MTRKAPANRTRSSYAHRRPVIYVLALIVAVLALSACQGTAEEESPNLGAAGQPARAQPAAEVEAVDENDAGAPVELKIPDVGLDASVVPMQWRIVTVEGKRTTAWDVPLDAIGWHVNSAGAGAAGNVLLSGRQADGDALLQPLALGAIKVGQDVILIDEDGQEFTYRIREVSEPIPISSATEEEEAQAQAYVSADDGALLTLISGWPEFTTTHRIFAVAELVATPGA